MDFKGRNQTSYKSTILYSSPFFFDSTIHLSPFHSCLRKRAKNLPVNINHKKTFLLLRAQLTENIICIDTAFKQQRLKAWQPLLTPKTVLPTLFVAGIIFAPLGGLFLYQSDTVSSLEFL